MNSDLSDQIDNEIQRDIEALPKLYPNDIKRGVDLPDAIYTNGYEFCGPLLWSSYASLILSKRWNAQCLFSDHITNFLEYKFGSNLINTNGLNNVSQSFDTFLIQFYQNII